MPADAAVRDAVIGFVADACFLAAPVAATVLPAIFFFATVPAFLPTAGFATAFLPVVPLVAVAFFAAACLPTAVRAAVRPGAFAVALPAPATLREADLAAVASLAGRRLAPVRLAAVSRSAPARAALVRRAAPVALVVLLRLAPAREAVDLLALVLRVAIGALHGATRSYPVSTPRIDAK